MKIIPLAHRMRPTKIEEVIGQKHLLGEGEELYRMIKNNHLSNMILYGPPGIGKTTIASAIAGSISLPFRALNGVTDGKKEIEKVINEAKKEDMTYVLYIDEIHRLTKTQSEPLLPAMEKGTVILIASTTESVFHHIPAGIRSRSRLFELNPLTATEMVVGLKRALEDKEKGLGNYSVSCSDDILLNIAESSGGDMRSALNALEVLITGNSSRDSEEIVEITSEMVERTTKRKNLGYNGEETRYDLMSAFQKSIRGSDVNAALYYLGLLLESGDLISITRRLLVIADEDIGMGNTNASTHALTAVEIAERVGLPEARIPLAKIVVELCLSPKSNTAYAALDAAIADIQSGQVHPIPRWLRDAHYQGASSRGNGVGYLYPHNYDSGSFGSWIPQQYLPDELKNKEYYVPRDAGHEKQFANIYRTLKEQKKNT